MSVSYNVGDHVSYTSRSKGLTLTCEVVAVKVKEKGILLTVMHHESGVPVYGSIYTDRVESHNPQGWLTV